MEMKEFDKIIGYTSIKKELEQIADTMKNNEVYAKLGVSVPKGLLLHGAPGVGKTLMASCLINASGRECFVCRKNQPDGDFVKSIQETFLKAAENAPAIVFLDDMDKFANEDAKHKNAEEYVTIQSCIDEVKEKDVFVLATANDLENLPDSLLRAGRFDRMIEVEAPVGQDAICIIDHYLKGKQFVSDADIKSIAKILDGCSCAELETVINEAGLYAGFERSESITMQHFIKACMRTIFKVPASVVAENYAAEEDWEATLQNGDNLISQIVYHEAGHAVLSEILTPDSVTLISAYNRKGTSGGFTAYYKNAADNPIKWKKSRIISGLGGMAALEQKFGITDFGSARDLDQVFDLVGELVAENCACGFGLHQVTYKISDDLRRRQEEVAASEVEKYYRKAKEILSLNWDFFEKVAAELAQKKILDTADVQRIKKTCKIVFVSI